MNLGLTQLSFNLMTSKIKTTSEIKPTQKIKIPKIKATSKKVTSKIDDDLKNEDNLKN